MSIEVISDRYISRLLKRYPVLEDCSESIKESAFMLSGRSGMGKTIFICGNGGSAADAEHIVGELAKSFRLPRPCDDAFKRRIREIDPVLGKEISVKLQKGIRSIPLTGMPSLSSAFANDVEADFVLAQQLSVMGNPGDLLWCLSTSGNSGNINAAAVTAKAMDIKVLGLTGSDGGRLKELSDVCIRVPETETYKVQELHLPVYHTICMILEEFFFAEDPESKSLI